MYQKYIPEDLTEIYIVATNLYNEHASEQIVELADSAKEKYKEVKVALNE